MENQHYITVPKKEYEELERIKEKHWSLVNENMFYVKIDMDIYIDAMSRIRTNAYLKTHGMNHGEMSSDFEKQIDSIQKSISNQYLTLSEELIKKYENSIVNINIIKSKWWYKLFNKL